MAIDPNLYRPHSLPRLQPSNYQADALVLWTHTTFDRVKLPLSCTFHSTIRELILHTCVREHLLCPVYVLMPDHIHLLLIGTQPGSDQLNATRFLRTHLARKLKPVRLQPQPHDHVFTAKERTKNSFAKAANYILQNPVRAELVTSPNKWPHTGAIAPGYPDLNPFDPDYFPTFWRIFQKRRDPACANHTPVRSLQTSANLAR
jgi:REP element-mobilizing transposase RayT